MAFPVSFKEYMMIAERELHHFETRQRLDSLCEKLDLVQEITLHGLHQLTATCTLYSPMGHPVSMGAGKGRDCELGAVAESLEHYFLERQAEQPPKHHFGSRITESNHYHDDWIIRSIPAETTVPSFGMQTLEHHQHIIVPSILLNPALHCSENAETSGAAFLSKYSSNSGTALGCTENEAFLHAINEAIERHALSAFYLSVCGLGPQFKLMTPAPELIQESFAKHPGLLNHVDQLNIYMTDVFYGVVFCIAIAPPEHSGDLSIVGSGCSAHAGVALYRAVTEQIQCAQLRGDDEIEEDQRTAALLAGSNKLHRLLYPRPDKVHAVFRPPQTCNSPRAQIQTTLRRLAEHRRTVFYHCLFNEPGLACVVQTYIPGFERFHLIRSGIPVVPQHALSAGARSPYDYL